MERIQTDAGVQLTSKEFQEVVFLHALKPTLIEPDHHEINGQVEVTRRTLQTIIHSIMVHAQVSEEYIHFALMYTTHHIFPVLPINHFINQDGEPTTQQFLLSNQLVLFCPCVVRKVSAHVDVKVLNMRHQSEKGFWGIFVGIPQHQKLYLINIHSTQKIVSSHDVVFGETFSISLSYT